ncbi:MAG: aryl-sulfate sulfotransferase, partial [Sutterella seckii]
VGQKGLMYLSVFDNGDGRGFDQPPLPDMKYSRAVIYRIDQERRTVEQIWEDGKGKGHEWFSPVTSLVEYMPDKDSIVTYAATAGANYDLKTGGLTNGAEPVPRRIRMGFDRAGGGDSIEEHHGLPGLRLRRP